VGEAADYPSHCDNKATGLKHRQSGPRMRIERHGKGRGEFRMTVENLIFTLNHRAGARPSGAVGDRDTSATMRRKINRLRFQTATGVSFHLTERRNNGEHCT
jgi:hypothetical protein